MQIMILVLLIISLTPLNSSFAKETSDIRITDGYIHNNHFYAVSYDEEGDAIVRAKIIIENISDKDLNELVFEIKGETVIYKIIQENIFESPSRISYEKNVESNSTELKLILPETVKPNQKTTIILFYKVSNEAKKDLIGVYSFNFQTIVDKQAALVENVRVSVTVQPELHLKGIAEGTINYKKDFISGATLGAMAMKEEFISDKVYKQYTDDIEYAYGLIKTTQNLDYLETFSVTGNYSKTPILLNLMELSFIAIITLLLLVLAAFTFKKFLQVNKLSIQTVTKNQLISKTTIQGLLTALIITGYWTIYYLLGQSIPQLFGYYAFPLIPLTLLLGGLALTAILLFVPPLYFALKQGPADGILTFTFTIMWGIILTSLFITIITLFINPLINPPQYPPIYY